MNDMECTCLYHPDRKAKYLCQKHGAYMCEECMKCRDPELFCKYREQCIIWFKTKKKGLD